MQSAKCPPLTQRPKVNRPGSRKALHRTDEAFAPPHIPLRYVIAITAVVNNTIKPVLVNKDHSARWKGMVRTCIPLSAIFLPAAFFLSVLTPTATEPNGLIYLADVGAVILAIGLIVLGIGLFKKPRRADST